MYLLLLLSIYLFFFFFEKNDPVHITRNRKLIFKSVE